MKKVILKQFNNEIGHAIVEDDKAQEMIQIYQSNYVGEGYTIDVIDLNADIEYQLKVCIANRMAEYPTPTDFMNAFFDGGESAIEALQAKRLEIKAKYPKP